MGINLQKGQRIDLTKGSTRLKYIMVGLGWDAAEQTSYNSKPIDCDASAILCNANGNYMELVCYRNLKSGDGAVLHRGDNLTGEGDGDDEQIMVDLNGLSSAVGKIVFVVNIFEAQSRNQHFGMINNAFIRLIDMDKNNELCRFNLSENYYGMEGLVVGEIYKKGNEWKFNAIGQPVKSASRVDALTELYR